MGSGRPDVTNCRSCGAKIYLPFSGGKYKPLDIEPVPCIEATDELPRTETLFTRGGVAFPAVTGDNIPDYVEDFFYGFRSHFVTCPAAREFRKKKQQRNIETEGQTSIFGGDGHG